MRGLAVAVWLTLLALPAAAQTCAPDGVQVQVLGSGGPELAGNRAASGYLVWIEGKARVLVDFGAGAALRFGAAGANAADLDAVLLTRLHAEHTTDLPALLHSSLSEGRARPLPVYGPAGNKSMPSTVAFVRALFDSTRGAYRHLGDVLNPMARQAHKLVPHDVRAAPARIGLPRKSAEETAPVYAGERLRASAAPVTHDNAPALVWRIEAEGKSIVFGGDALEDGDLEKFVRGADLLIAHHAVAEVAADAERAPHAPPSVIGRLAREAGIKQLVLSHRTRATLGREEESLEILRRQYAGTIAFANDLDCFRP